MISFLVPVTVQLLILRRNLDPSFNMAAPLRKRLTLLGGIHRAADDDDYRIDMLEELTTTQEDLINYRASSNSTQSAQNTKLEHYQKFVLICLKGFGEGKSDDIIERICFPDDQGTLTKQLEV